jgi:hypothetical protein
MSDAATAVATAAAAAAAAAVADLFRCLFMDDVILSEVVESVTQAVPGVGGDLHITAVSSSSSETTM